MSHDYNNRYVGPALDLLMEGLHIMAAARSGAGRAYGGARAGHGAGGFNEPVPQQGEPQGVLRSGDVAVRIEGELVPVVDVALGALGGREGGCA
jgi:hypothetical protein